MVSVTELGYIGIGVADERAWRDYATQIVGLELLDEGLEDRFFLRMDTWHHRITVHRDGEDDLLYLGWRVAGRTQFEQMKEQLAAAGVAFREGSEKEAEERHVLGVLKLTDPGGIGTEIFYGPEVALHRPFHPGRPLHGRFYTGDGGLGHCIVNQPDPEAAYQFYRLLGMEGGVDYKVGPPDVPVNAELTFMRCNDRQHSIAWGTLGATSKRMNHLMIEYQDLNDLGITHDMVRERQLPVAMALGIHSNDRVLSFYSVNPSGWLVELGVQVGQTYAKQNEYYRKDIFGHQLEKTGFIFSDADQPAQ